MIRRERPAFDIPATTKARVAANLAILEHLADIDAGAAPDVELLSTWSGWGGAPAVLDPHHTDLSDEHARLTDLLDPTELKAAAASTLNAHFTPRRLVDALWRIVTGLGLDSGHVLEPAAGSGIIAAAAPAGFDVVGVELEPVTALVAQLITEGAVTEGDFAEFRARDGVFDAVVTNVPFGDHSVHDPIHNPNPFSIHNYFLAKSLHLVRPGGLVVAVTSRHTMDATGNRARSAFAELADLVGVLRLPAGAMASTSGTSVVADVVVFRRRPVGAAARSASDWLPTGSFEGRSEVPINVGFGVHRRLDYSPVPDPRFTVLGTFATGTNRWGYDLTVDPADPTDPLAGLEDAVSRLVDTGVRLGLAATAPADDAPAPVVVAAAGEPEGSWRIRDGLLEQVVEGAWTTATRRNGTVLSAAGKTKTERELVALIEIRDAIRALLAAQDDGCTDTELAGLQEALSGRYMAYRGVWGPINRVTLTESVGTDGEAKIVRRRPTLSGFRSDPDVHLVSSIESYDEASGYVELAPIFTRRIIANTAAPHRVDTPADAIAVCHDTAGRLDRRQVARLAGIGPDAVDGWLGDLAYTDPDTGDLVPAASYLSGRVRTKLAAAQAAATTNPEFARNVAALEAVQPADLAPEEIEARLGASWIPAGVVVEFMDEIGCGRGRVTYLAGTGTWTVEANSWHGPKARQWGTNDLDAWQLLARILNNKPIEVQIDALVDGHWRKVRDESRTLLAVERADALAERFSLWIWSNPDRTTGLCRLYNDRFNDWVDPAWDGTHLTFPGMSPAWAMRPHQANAVWRAVTEDSVLFAHAVGAGKTACLAGAAVEARRLGKASKPMLVVPNHLLDQIARDILRIYPHARVFVADKTEIATKDARRRFVARVATGDWDLVVTTLSVFSRIPTRPTTRTAHIDDQVHRASLDLDSLSRYDRSVKRIQARLEKLRTRRQALVAEHNKDDGLCFEDLGVDLVMVDEAHLVKNLGLPTQTRGVVASGSQRAEDMAIKLDWVRARYGNGPILSTGTPITNSVAELYVALRYLDPARLDEVGCPNIDSWLSIFTQPVTALELAPEGRRMRVQTRIARYQNRPELAAMFRERADVHLDADALGIPRPDKATHVIALPCPPQVERFVDGLMARADAVRDRRVRPEDDNMLKVCNDGRKVSVDPRLVDVDADTKIPAAADRIAARYHDHTDREYFDDLTGAPHPTLGGFQLVFCDIGVNAAPFSTYTRLRDALVARGVPVDAIEFAQSVNTDADKAALHQRCRTGATRVLIASTATAGLGTNIATRLPAVHHLDSPWRPDEVEQRNGRGWRQGNQHDVVEVFHYVVEGTFDAYLHQLLELKARWASSILSADPAVRVLDDLSDGAVLTYNHLKAAATGDDRLVRLAELEAERDRLRRLEVAWIREHHHQRLFVAETPDAIAELEARARFNTQLADTVADAECRTSLRDQLDTVLNDSHYRTQGLLNNTRWQVEGGHLVVTDYYTTRHITLPKGIGSWTQKRRRTWITRTLTKVAAWVGENPGIAERVDQRRAEAEAIDTDVVWAHAARLDDLTAEAETLRVELEDDHTATAA